MSQVETSHLLPRLLPDRLPLNLRLAPAGVTIVIPNWNHEYVLARSIRSALKAVKNLHDQGVSILLSRQVLSTWKRSCVCRQRKCLWMRVMRFALPATESITLNFLAKMPAARR